MPSYPTTLNPPHSQGFSLAKKKFSEGIITDIGINRQRRVISNNFYVVTMQFDFKSKNEFDEFLKWVKYDINYGNLWFNADWLSDIGFTSGEWVWRFVSIPFSATGYSMGFGCTLLMAPKNNNVVNSNYTEIGIASSYIDKEYPFGYDIFECDDFSYYRTYVIDDDSFLFTSEWNGFNWYVVGNKLDVASLGSSYDNIRGIACTKENYVAFSSEQIGTHAKLRMFYFDGDDWSEVGTPLTLTGYSPVNGRITRLSDNRVVYIDSFSGKIDVYEYNYTTNIWAKIGLSTDINSFFTPYTPEAFAVALSSNRIVMAVTTHNQLVVMDFNGTSFSQVGSTFQIPSFTTNSPYFASMTLLDTNQIGFAIEGGSGTYNQKITKFTYTGSSFTLGTPSSTARNNAQFSSIAAIAKDKIAWSCIDSSSDYGLFGMVFDGSKFVETGNNSVNIPGIKTYSVTSPYKVY